VLFDTALDHHIQARMISADDANLERFGRHVPRVLGNQIIAQLVDQYLSDVNSPSIEPEFEKSCPPSIERFHAALLFVDISGFTILSQRLPVDALRLHINAYFKKILDIIFKYGGDVIKFAGDALFITWQTPVSDLGKSDLNVMLKRVINSHSFLLSQPR
jgi:class 3 adenylate cyclase